MSADVNHSDQNGQTPLYYAIRGVRMDTVEFFVREVGSNINHEDFKHETPMTIAKRTGKKYLVQFLLSNGAKALEEIRK